MAQYLTRVFLYVKEVVSTKEVQSAKKQRHTHKGKIHAHTLDARSTSGGLNIMTTRYFV